MKNKFNFPKRLRKEIAAKLKEYGVQDGRHTNLNTLKRIKKKDYGDDVNFDKKSSGHPDLDESGDAPGNARYSQHHTKYKVKKTDFGDDVNFEKDGSGQPDLDEKTNVNLTRHVRGNKVNEPPMNFDDDTNFDKKSSGQPDLEETLQLNIRDISDLIPSNEYQNNDFKGDLVKAINYIYKKHHINITIKFR